MLQVEKAMSITIRNRNRKEIHFFFRYVQNQFNAEVNEKHTWHFSASSVRLGNFLGNTCFGSSLVW